MPTAFDIIAGREICRKTPAGREEYRRRTMLMAIRQGMICPLCGEPLGLDITFDHQSGRGMNASIRDERIVVDDKWKNAAVHSKCNALKASKRYAWIGRKYLPVVKGHHEPSSTISKFAECDF